MPSRLLALPQELRTKVYEELLCPEPARPLTLWHDRNGRQGSLNLHPSILRVNKQTHCEAASLLYDNNIFEINLTAPVCQTQRANYIDGRRDPPPLFRKDAMSADPWLEEIPATDPPHFLQNHKGVIYTQSFQRLRHIKIKTKTTAVWAWTTRESGGRPFFTRTGELIIRTLQLLSEQQRAVMPIRQTFDFEVVPDWRTKYGVFQADFTDANDDTNLLEMLQLLNMVGKTRTVLIEEYIKPRGRGGDFLPLTKVKVDLDPRL